MHPYEKFSCIDQLVKNQMSGRDEQILQDCPGDPGQFRWIFADRSMPTKLSETLSKQELRALIIGLVKLDHAHRGAVCAGSASPVPALYYRFAERYPDDEPVLTEWIVKNRFNAYDPYGTLVRNDALRLEDHRAYFRKRAAEQARINLHREEWQQYRRDVRHEMKAIRADRNLPGAISRGDIPAVKSLINNGALLESVQESSGMSPIQLALKNQRGDMAVFLYNTYYQ
jgi:hypothetical protein